MRLGHALSALLGVVLRDGERFLGQKGRLLAALLRPALWLLIFAAGLGVAFGEAAVPPYDRPVAYPVYILPGLLGMVLLFNGMQSSLSMVYDREMGVMRLLLTAPLPRWYLLLCRLLAGVALSVVQAYAFLVVAALFGLAPPLMAWVTVLPALVAGGLMLGAMGLLLSVHIRQLENFAGTMNFVIFPMFFLSSALYPVERLASGGAILEWTARLNPFTHAVELIRFALYGRLEATAVVVVLGAFAIFFIAAAQGYDPQRGMLSRAGRES